MVGKRPLEVGANLIARTVVTALNLLSDLRRNTGEPIPLAWSPEELPAVSAIEVYPAATLRSRGLQSEGYKGQKGLSKRERLAEQISREFEVLPNRATIVDSDHAFDALLCALAGIDFIRGESYPPIDEEIARKEGWIWFRRRV